MSIEKNNETILTEKIRNIIADQLMVEEQEVTNESSFINDLGADSLDVVELIMEFEDQFDVEISDEEAEKIVTVADAIVYLVPLLFKKQNA